jgi:hypothetical protein
MFMITGDDILYLLPRDWLRADDLRSIEVAEFSADRSPGAAGTAGSIGVCHAGVTIVWSQHRCNRRAVLRLTAARRQHNRRISTRDASRFRGQAVARIATIYPARGQSTGSRRTRPKANHILIRQEVDRLNPPQSSVLPAAEKENDVTKETTAMVNEKGP